ncbi:ATP-dependent protease ATPase subunit HslU [Truepera radiovictrix]|uniref:Heat shock protein HslVU, ATPase subunit HslU n=1 Tax=Truepera radiovictrix (strain DSM 17093 / CIP 108686 / LMG 22925 / RQ-24) TaxID=649638 RepID=D7CRA0_TRURR|nr:ATP-dependent protease ATPase subunit HslU [Truepera radiovictrix]ADI15188.1 heat shock protein HslVU, ATPase subunit HslU [Truepera radiovictrix DSM 17093]WMT56261.1 ATP-dependent protease ATPase subunit HslU [Truepera radiovictrix]
MLNLTPLEIVEELDKYIIGQHKAKRSVAVALRNHFRRRQLAGEIQREVTPKNILMIGPTGVGKTEIARRLARLARAPFVKVEATKFTETGYVGRDVESMVRDLVQASYVMVQEEQLERVSERAAKNAEEHLLDALLPGGTEEGRAKMRELLEAGKLEDRSIEIEVKDERPQQMMMPGMEEMGLNLQEMMSNLLPKRRVRRKTTVREAREALRGEEAEKLIDHDEVSREAISRAENSGIIFIDEIDKVTGSDNTSGPDVSGEGVQRDLLPIVEGTQVNTRYGQVKTDHVLFIAAGAFTASKPSDLIPELQGRFPIRVELEELSASDFQLILTKPQYSLTKQYTELLKVDGTRLRFDDSGIEAIAEYSARVNADVEDIGARRLHTVLETVLEDVSFATNLGDVVIDRAYVEKKLEDIASDEDLSRYVL